MRLLDITVLLILAPIGMCAIITCVGWWATINVRLNHQREMVRLAEQSKLNAVTIQERQTRMLDGTPIGLAQELRSAIAGVVDEIHVLGEPPPPPYVPCSDRHRTNTK